MSSRTIRYFNAVMRTAPWREHMDRETKLSRDQRERLLVGTIYLLITNSSTAMLIKDN
jgi:hypothetical protein